MAKKYWLMKVEPDAYSIDDFEKEGETCWEGVRNYQARNILRDDVQVGDGVLFYQSNADPTGVAGVAEVSKAGYPDHFSWKKGHKYFDEKSSPDEPRWFMVDIRFKERFDDIVTLKEMKENKKLNDMMVTKKGMRLSVQPVKKGEFNEVLKMGRAAKKPAGGKTSPKLKKSVKAAKKRKSAKK